MGSREAQRQTALKGTLRSYPLAYKKNPSFTKRGDFCKSVESAIVVRQPVAVCRLHLDVDAGTYRHNMSKAGLRKADKDGERQGRRGHSGQEGHDEVLREEVRQIAPQDTLHHQT